MSHLPGRLLVAMVFLPALVLGASERLPVHKLTGDELTRLPGGTLAQQRELVRQRISAERWRAVHDLVGERHVSAKSQHLLQARRAADKVAGVDTLRVLLVRISFASDRSGDLTSVTEDGNFQLGGIDPADTQALHIDPPPHNRAYFESHLQGLAQYYRFQSGGRLHIESRVLPEGSNDSYQVDDLDQYGPSGVGWWTLEGLEQLVRDMIGATDVGTQTDGSVNLADFDADDPFTYVIFAHAGSDWQSDINQDSPNDVPTFFVTLGDSVPLTSVDSHTGQPGYLRECSVIPETTNQDGYLGSIAAALYHEFGHALGLVDVYDATSGLTSVGVWDLMDSGTNLAANLGVDTNGDGIPDVGYSVTGILPPSLGAWDKWFLGWVECDTLGGSAREVKLPAVGVPREQYARFRSVGDFDRNDPQALIAGASAREFFLIENRWVPLELNDTPFDNISFEADDTTGVVLYLAGEFRGEWSNSGLYDYFMPEGGLLVWHVNMDRIEANLATNTINMYGDGLRLVEADGIQDIGVINSYVLGWSGSSRDPFSPYNPDGFLELSVAGRPDSRAFDQSLTGVHLWDIADDGDAHGAVMRFQAAIEPLVGAFPYTLPDDAGGPRALAPASLVTLNGELLAGADTHGAMFAVGLDGTQAIAPGVDLGEPAGPVVTLGDGQTAVIGLRDGDVVAWTPAGGQAWRTTVADTLTTGAVPVALDDRTLVLCAAGPSRSVLLDAAGQAVGSAVACDGIDAFTAAPRVWSHGDAATIVYFGASGFSTVDVDRDGFLAAPEFHSYEMPTAAAVVHPALVPGPDSARLVVLGEEGALGAWRLALGEVVAAAWSGGAQSPLVADPAVADLDGDGHNDVVAVTARSILAWTADGVSLTGFPARLPDLFPLPDTTTFAGALVVADGTGDGLNEVYATTSEGHLLGLSARGALLDLLPLRFGDRSATSLSVGPGPDGRRTLYLASAGGYLGPPFERRHLNGRIVGYALAAKAATGTSEWLGPQGGPTGIAQALGSLSPAAAEADRVVIYPCPLRGREATLRFTSAGGPDAQLSVFTLEGEEVLHRAIPVSEGGVMEHTFTLDVAPGVYVCRLERQGANGWTRTITALAVER